MVLMSAIDVVHGAPLDRPVCRSSGNRTVGGNRTPPMDRTPPASLGTLPLRAGRAAAERRLA